MSSVVPSQRLAALREALRTDTFTARATEDLKRSLGPRAAMILGSPECTAAVAEYAHAALALSNVLQVKTMSAEWAGELADAALEYRRTLVGVKASIVAKAAELLCGTSDLPTAG
ncbi:MAG TPA: hypothetical protein VGQ96_00905 [Candidatus Eremiobacteraceae bacterium]|nr:hypothetical protein [Candidatus Eremiobacteraceae bacterium]